MIFFYEDEEGIVREESSDYPYLLMLMKLWPRNWNNQLKRMNMKVDEDNDKSLEMANGARSIPSCPVCSHFLVCSENYF